MRHFILWIKWEGISGSFNDSETVLCNHIILSLAQKINVAGKRELNETYYNILEHICFIYSKWNITNIKKTTLRKMLLLVLPMLKSVYMYVSMQGANVPFNKHPLTITTTIIMKCILSWLRWSRIFPNSCILKIY